MKKTLFRLFVALMAMVILCTQLPLGYLTGANSASIQPTDYPSRTVLKLSADLEYMGIVPNASNTETDFIESVDLTSEDYDTFEFDMFLSHSGVFSGAVELAIFDEGGSQATYNIPASLNQWLHISINIDDFVKDGIDMKNVVGYRINNPESYVQYKFVNLCLTGVKRPTDVPVGDVDYLVKRLDVIDSSTKSSNSDVFDFGEIASVDFLSKDWLEFDIYVIDGGEDSVDINMGLAFTDVNFDPVKSTFGKNTVNLSNISVKTNDWNHIKIPTANFTVHKTCKSDEIVGVRVTNMKDNYRYVIGNIILKTAVVDAPAIPEGTDIVAEGEIIQTYSVIDGTESEYVEFENAVDLSQADHIVTDLYADSAVAGRQKIKLNLKDEAGKKAAVSIDIDPGVWVNTKTLIDAFDAEDGFDYTKVKAIKISELVRTTRYFLSNLYLTNAVIDIKAEYPYNAILKFDNIDVDYFADASNDNVAKSYVDLGDLYDVTQYDYIEFDLFVDTPIDSTELPTTIQLEFIDNNGKKVLGTRDYTYNTSQHIRILTAALYTKESYTGNKANIRGFNILEAFDDSRYVIKNFCLTKIIAPEAPTKDLLIPLLKYSDITPKYQHFYDSDVVFDGLERGPTNEDGTYDTSLDSYDATVGEEIADEYLQFDIYVVLDESSKHYDDEIGISFKMCDRPNYERHASENGRGHASFSVKTNEWQHVRIALSSFGVQPGRTPCDFNHVARYFLEGNAVGTRYIVANMWIGKRDTLPLDEDKEIMPEKSGVRYVTNCDSANSSENGVWTSSQTQFTTDYKTEGKGSALLKVMNQETAAMNSHRFLFSSAADLRKSKSVKFDLFVDDLTLASTCDYNVYLSSDRRNTTDNFIYNIDPASLKLGWNNFDIPLSAFKSNDEEFADWASIQCFAIEVLLNQEFKSYGSLQEYFILCLDNVRISDTYVLNAEVTDEPIDTVPDPDTNDNNKNNNGTITKETHTTITNPAEIITLDPEENTTYITKRVIKKQKVVLDTILQSHWIILIITCCVAVVLIAGSIVLVILSTRKNKLGGSKK